MFNGIMQVLGFGTNAVAPSASPQVVYQDEDKEDIRLSFIGRKVPTDEARAVVKYMSLRGHGLFGKALMELGRMQPALRMVMRQASTGYLDNLSVMSRNKRARGIQDWIDGWTDECGRQPLMPDIRVEPWERLGICSREEAENLRNSPNKIWAPDFSACFD